MKGKIDKFGHLFIYRKSRYRAQCCPFINSSENMSICCGDWCPHFGEPEFHEIPSAGKIIKEWILRICQNKILVFDEFIDER